MSQTTANSRQGVVKTNAILDFDSYAQISGVRGYQFGKEVFSSLLKFKDLEKFLATFPNVQRGMSKANVKAIKKYVLSGIGENSDAYMRFFNSITVTCRGNMIYDDDKRTILIDTTSKLSINDGQHRTEGIKEALEELRIKLNKTHDLSDKQKIEDQLDALENMTVPVIIFNGLDESQESQLFYDLNNLQRRPSKNANIRLSQTDLFAKMAKNVAETNRYFTHYGIEIDKQSIYSSNPNTFLLNTVYNSIKELLYANLILDKNFLKPKNFDRFQNEVNAQFDKILYALPNDMDVKGKYIIEKNYALTGISKFVAYMKDSKFFADEADIYKVIEETDWTFKNPDWVEYGGIRGSGKRNNIIFGASSTGKKAVFSYLIDRAEAYKEKKVKGYVKN